MSDFRKKVIYQIYPKSFMDSNGDGIGDLQGILQKLDYVSTLGVDYIWMTPFFVSPQKDNGYDVADYYTIDPRFGTMKDIEDVIQEAGKRNIKVMLDMVFNHVSDQSEWFQKALTGDETYKKYFFFKKGKANGMPPNNWISKFGGSAWEYVESLDEYYLHVFDVSQPDLNWENEVVRKELQNIILFWMDKGVKGFRFDVINLISKASFEDDNEGDGRRFFTDGPRVHEFIHELQAATFGRDAEIITVGEMNSTSMEHCYEYAGRSTEQLNMAFNFHHMKVDYVGMEKWVLVPFDFAKLKDILFNWQVEMQLHDAWNAVFWCNHDQPRAISRFGNVEKYWKESGKMLATLVHCLRGTPYIYQGEELGMSNANYTSIDQYRDVESLNHYRILQDKGILSAHALDILQVHSRDNSRTPMQWDTTIHGGFSTGTPWIPENPNFDKINASQQLHDEDSIFAHYQKLIQLRKQYDVIAYGDICPIAKEHTRVFAYKRKYQDEELIVINNFYGTTTSLALDFDVDQYTCILHNIKERTLDHTMNLEAYESLVFYRNKQ